MFGEICNSSDYPDRRGIRGIDRPSSDAQNGEVSGAQRLMEMGGYGRIEGTAKLPSIRETNNGSEE